ncbi:unnamed protein product [Penicillium camemberti]|uniref:Str. FM013 n=1 Tax=Penicillium camemberti (strain FM 013) TaxID=1429867 RepID=A0A0G4P496_PENC3|nr:unnamed protein product [Penicillium camemberti]
MTGQNYTEPLQGGASNYHRDYLRSWGLRTCCISYISGNRAASKTGSVIGKRSLGLNTV